MALTVFQAETIVISRASGFMTKCGLSVIATGSNLDLADPVASALRALGLPVANYAVPVDTDLQGLADFQVDLYLGIVQLFTLRACWGRWARVDQAISLGNQKLGQLADQIQAAHDQLAADLLARYGFGRLRRRQPKMGVITAGNTWPPNPPPPFSPQPWPAGYSPPPGPLPGPETGWGFNP